MKKIYVIKNVEIEATDLAEAKAIYNKQVGNETLEMLKTKAKELIDGLEQKIIKYTQENLVVKEYSYYNFYNDCITTKKTINVDNCEELNSYNKLYRFVEDNTSRRTDVDLWVADFYRFTWEQRAEAQLNKTTQLIYASTKEAYKKFINNYEDKEAKIMKQIEVNINFLNENIEDFLIKKVTDIEAERERIKGSIELRLERVKENQEKADALIAFLKGEEA